MTANERILKIATSSPAMLAKIDALLAGDETHVPKKDPDVRTCTLTEAARRIGVSRPTIYRLINRGSIATIDLMGVPRVVLQSLFDYVRNYERVSGIAGKED